MNRVRHHGGQGRVRGERASHSGPAHGVPGALGAAGGRRAHRAPWQREPCHFKRRGLTFQTFRARGLWETRLTAGSAYSRAARFTALGCSPRPRGGAAAGAARG
ncbi:unnamed protein product [Amoebophrya sp. A120]|nr:unnamed protein product [Amoebophrya sp. A120]|eukprot:GSA120T00017922001.1